MRLFWLPLLAAWLCVSCAYIGDPLPPALHIPLPVQQLAVVQRASKLQISFSVPAETTEGLPLQLGRVEVRVDEANPSVVAEAEQPGPVATTLDAAPYAGREIAVSARVVHRRGRASEWSPAVRLRVIAPVGTPADLVAQDTAEGVRLTWQALQPGLRYRIYRRRMDSTPATEELAELASTEQASYLDAAARYDTQYEYAVQALQPTPAGTAESERSDPIKHVPNDRFAPPPPTGLSALPGVASIQLTWEQSSAIDFAAYRVYRSREGSPRERIGQEVAVPSYSDNAVESGKRYRYAITAVDRKGNQSGASAEVEVAAP